MDERASDCNPEKGLRLEWAMGWYGNQAIAQAHPNHKAVAIIEQSARYSSRHNLQPGDPFYVDPSRLPELRRRATLQRKLLLADIAAHLRSGKLYALGLRVGEYTPVRIPREWWQVATLDPDLNTAEGNGVLFSGLLVFEDAAVAASEQDQPGEAGPADPAATWMRDNVTEPGTWKRDAAIEQCSQQTGATYRAAQAAWNNLPDDIRGKRGVHK